MGVVEAVDVSEERIGHLLSCLPLVPPDEFSLQRFEEGLDKGVIITISLAAHGYLEPKLSKPLLIIVRTILTAPVCVMNAAWWWTS